MNIQLNFNLEESTILQKALKDADEKGALEELNEKEFDFIWDLIQNLPRK